MHKNIKKYFQHQVFFIRFFFSFAIFFILNFYNFALTISIIPSQNNGFSLREPMNSLMTGFMDKLYENGQIVTNSDNSSINFDKWPDMREINIAIEGKVDIVFFIYVIWNSARVDKKIILAKKIEYQMYNTSDKKVIIKGSISGSVDTGDENQKPETEAKRLGTQLGELCIKTLNLKGSKRN